MNDLSESELLLGFSTILTCYSSYRWIKERKKRKNNRLYFTRLDSLPTRNIEYFEEVFHTIKNDPNRCFKHTRMPLPIFNKLVSLLNPRMQREKTTCPRISTETRLALTLSYLAQGVTELFLRWAFKVGRPQARAVVAETCESIWEVLSPDYVALPNFEDIQSIADDFNTEWDLPNCLGALDAKCFPIQRTTNIRSASLVLVASCDTQYAFRLVDTQVVENEKDKAKLPKLLNCIFSGTFPLPPETCLPNSNLKFPFYFVGDILFPLKSNLMRPYPERGSAQYLETQIFNYRIARGRLLVENSFGILMARWRVLRLPLNFSPAYAQRIILATVALHNFIKSNHIAARQYCPPRFADIEDNGGDIIPGKWRDDVDSNSINSSSQFNKFGSNNTTRNAIDHRDILRNYFSKEGAISLQCFAGLKAMRDEKRLNEVCKVGADLPT